MPKRTSSYHSWLVEKLKNPEVAESYLKTALDDSQEAFLTALRNVAEARGIAKIAQETGLNRESLYRALSSEGNPTLSTLSAVLQALGLRMNVTGKWAVASASVMPAPDRSGLNISSSILAGTADSIYLAGGWSTTTTLSTVDRLSAVSFSTRNAQRPEVPFFLIQGEGTTDVLVKI